MFVGVFGFLTFQRFGKVIWKSLRLRITDGKVCRWLTRTTRPRYSRSCRHPFRSWPRPPTWKGLIVVDTIEPGLGAAVILIVDVLTQPVPS